MHDHFRPSARAIIVEAILRAVRNGEMTEAEGFALIYAMIQSMDTGAVPPDGSGPPYPPVQGRAFPHTPRPAAFPSAQIQNPPSAFRPTSLSRRVSPPRRRRNGGTTMMVLLSVGVVVALLVSFVVRPTNGWSGGQERRITTISSPYAVYSPPTMTREQYGRALVAAGSPLAVEGESVYDALIAANVDPAVHLAFLLLDSDHAGDLAYPPPRGGRNPHDLRLCPTCGSAMFASYTECVSRWVEAVRRETNGAPTIALDDIVRIQFAALPDDAQQQTIAYLRSQVDRFRSAPE